MPSFAENQAFDIWYKGEPKLTFDDARKACGEDSHKRLAHKIFFSDRFAFDRWLFTSGFQEFVETQSAEPPYNEYDCDYGPSPREETLDVLKRLWTWMKYNEKQIS